MFTLTRGNRFVLFDIQDDQATVTSQMAQHALGMHTNCLRPTTKEVMSIEEARKRWKGLLSIGYKRA